MYLSLQCFIDLIIVQPFQASCQICEIWRLCKGRCFGCLWPRIEVALGEDLSITCAQGGLCIEHATHLHHWSGCGVSIFLRVFNLYDDHDRFIPKFSLMPGQCDSTGWKKIKERLKWTCGKWLIKSRGMSRCMGNRASPHICRVWLHAIRGIPASGSMLFHGSILWIMIRYCSLFTTDQVQIADVQQHGVDTAKYYRQAERELAAEQAGTTWEWLLRI